ncbi:ABC transporter permease [Kytococcus sedentarius]|uniref:ABC transporter permease n=1 Tax=Kytococcus sedentarius TaxID=1276 RepID=UPI00384E3A54
MRSRGSAWVPLAWALLPLVFFAVFFAWPVGSMVGRGLFPGGSPDLSALPEVLGRGRTLRVLGFTVGMALAGTVVTLLLGLPTAFVLYRLAFPMRGLARSWVVMPFVLPTVVVGVMFRSLLAPGGPLGFLGWDGTPWAIGAAFVFFNLAVVVRTVGGVWAGLDRRPEEAAASLGAAPWQVLRDITLPRLMPAITSAAVVVFLFCSTAFGVVLTLGGLRHRTIETEIYLLTTQYLDLRAAAVLSVLQVLVVGLLVWVAGRLRGSARATGASSRPRPMRRGDIPAVAVALGVLAFITAPVVALVVRSLQVPTVDGARWSLRNYRALASPEAAADAALQVTVLEALEQSWRTAVDATVVALVLGALVAIALTRPGRTPGAARTVRTLDLLFMLPLGVSAVTVGFGFLIALDTPPLDLRGSPLLVPLAQALVATPLVVRTLVPALGGVDDRQRQAAASLGAPPWRQFLTIDARLAARPAAAAAGFALAVSLGEFGATSFLARPDTPTVPVVIAELIGRPGAETFGMALAASVLLAAVTVAVMAVVDRLAPTTGGSW